MNLARALKRYLRHRRFARLCARAKAGATSAAVISPRPALSSLWAHAGGGLLRYGNAQESIDRSVAAGFGVVEIDISVTTDGVPVLSHNFRPDGEWLYDGFPTLKQFLDQRLHDTLTPLTLEGCLERYRSWQGLFCLDQSVQLRGSGFDFFAWMAEHVASEHRKNLVMQAYSFEDLRRLAVLGGFAGIHYCLDLFAYDAYELRLLAEVLRAYGVGSVSIGDCPITDAVRTSVGLLVSAGLRVGLYGINSKSRCRCWKEVGATVFDTDDLQPGDGL